jgi:hypothetical protein
MLRLYLRERIIDILLNLIKSEKNKIIIKALNDFIFEF